jgi:hypothetical protein
MLGFFGKRILWLVGVSFLLGLWPGFMGFIIGVCSWLKMLILIFSL